MSKDKKNEELVDDQDLGAPEEVGVEEIETEEPDKSPEELLEESRAEVVEWQDTALRAMAEFENYKKRMERERSTMLKYSGESIFRELLPVVDNLERAVEQGIVDGVEAEQNLNALLEGVELTLKSLQATLEKFEVKPIDAVGQPFDPTVQEALSMEASASVPANHVVSEFEKGYHYKDRLLRAARVIVSSGAGNG
ncbi:MAG: nucleotide exchange factor GrpE [Desulfofustis sp.]|nr:nucleotide exchange factor GrpE [Desulfofustis sp.]